MRAVALLASYNERRFIGACLEHLARNDIDAYLIDNCSTDDTVALAEAWLGRGLLGIESFPRKEGDVYDWRALLERKEQLARKIDADWFIHMDPDEFRLPPRGKGSLAEALEAVEREGFNAVNFTEYTFVPSRESPDHDHPDFQRTLRTYYPFAPKFPHQLNAWKATDEIELARSGGHEVRFSGLRMHPEAFPMKHYLFLSIPHAIEKYVKRHYDPGEVKGGWHGWRAALTAGQLCLPSASELRVTRSDDDLDPSEPRAKHYLEPHPANEAGPESAIPLMPGPEDVPPGTTLLSTPQFDAWLRSRLAEREPAAVVRFGDAEARLLMGPRPEKESMQDAIRKLGLETGLPFSPADVTEIQTLVSLAFDQADVLGIRYGHRFLTDHKRWMDRVSTIYSERVAAGRPPATLAHCLLSHQIADSLPELLAGRAVSVISCRNLGPVLEGEWGLDDVAVYQVPSQHTVRDVDGTYEAAMYEVPIWPDAHASVRSQLTVREQGEVFLIGAGLFGKGLCIDVRNKGGIALDMGSALDRIAGKVTRGPKRRALDLQAKGMSAEQIASRLQSVYGVDVDRETVSRGLAELQRERLANRRAELAEELNGVRREGRRLTRQLETLERERATKVALIETLEAEVARTAKSRSFRYGHGILRRISRWTMRRPARRSALDAAGNLLQEARRDLGRVTDGGPR
jgi:glycosyl transferase family 2